jgi:3-hydroxybutyryl-CoA dehydrogenase
MKAGEVTRVGVVGAGLMGSGIVEVCAKAGLQVTYLEADAALVNHGRSLVEGSLEKAVQRGKLDEASRDGVLARISGSTDLDSLSAADLVIEAVVEDLAVKLDLFRRLDQVVRPEVVLASNTSSLPIVALAAATGRPDRVVGMHFFNPPPVMKLLELVRGLTTSDETVDFARAMGERLGKTAILAKDRAGFVVNMLLVPYLNGAIRMLEEGFATAEDIDTGVTLGLGHPMGPLTLLDLVGLDTAMHVGEVLYEEFHEPTYAPPPLLRRMVAAGYLGRKSGRGFFDYAGRKG